MLSQEIDFCGMWGVKEKEAGWQCVGVTSVSKKPRAHASVFDLASADLAGAVFHGQHIAHGIKRM